MPTLICGKSAIQRISFSRLLNLKMRGGDGTTPFSMIYFKTFDVKVVIFPATHIRIQWWLVVSPENIAD